MGERDLSQLSTADIVRCGLVRVAQGASCFEMSVMEISNSAPSCRCGQ
jgi:hypothetical protein